MSSIVLSMDVLTADDADEACLQRILSLPGVIDATCKSDSGTHQVEVLVPHDVSVANVVAGKMARLHPGCAVRWGTSVDRVL